MHKKYNYHSLDQNNYYMSRHIINISLMMHKWALKFGHSDRNISIRIQNQCNLNIQNFQGHHRLDMKGHIENINLTINLYKQVLILNYTQIDIILNKNKNLPNKLCIMLMQLLSTKHMYYNTMCIMNSLKMWVRELSDNPCNKFHHRGTQFYKKYKLLHLYKKNNYLNMTYKNY